MINSELLMDLTNHFNLKERSLQNLIKITLSIFNRENKLKFIKKGI